MKQYWRFHFSVLESSFAPRENVSSLEFETAHVRTPNAENSAQQLGIYMKFSWFSLFAKRLLQPVLHPRHHPVKPGRSLLRVEPLESRDVPTAVFTPDYVVLTPTNSATPFGTTGPTGYTPTEIRDAYGFNQISFNGTAGTGAGTTIAIVDAYS